MSAFDTSTNTASLSFTNAYGTAVLQPSDTRQYVYGFGRNTGKRYLEFYVDDQGGDFNKLWVSLIGAAFPGDAGKLGNVYGSSSQETGWYQNAFASSTTSSNVPNATISTGDTWMFCVDFGGGTDHNGVQRHFTITDHSGNLLLPVYVDIGRNGTWGLYSIYDDIFSAFGYSGIRWPLVVRESTSASSATVSLRVVTTSFVYTIPTGFVAWGDGPQGGGPSTLSDASVYWDPAKTSSQMTLTGNNLYAKYNTSYTATSGEHFWYTTMLPSTGKRIIETINRGATATRGPPYLGIGLADQDISITATVDTSTKKIGRNWFLSYFDRGVNCSASTTWGASSNGIDFYGETPGLILFIDFDSGRLWQTGGLISAVSGQLCFQGIAGAGRCDPYLGNSGQTFTNSVGMRMYCELRKNNTVSGCSVYLNAGQTAFETFPQLPGWISMDGGRRVYGVGAQWDTAQTYAGSTTFYASNLAVRTTAPNVMQGTTKKNTGKYYFEIFRQCQQVGNIELVGVRRDGETSMSACFTASWAPSGLWFDEANKRKTRYGTAASWTNSSSQLSAGSLQTRFGIAINFDLGHIWCGIWNKLDRQMNWVSGADPATGVQPDMTFTACTTFVCAAVTQGGVTPGGNVLCLVAEDTNVIGLPTGFLTWNGTTSVTASATMTPSAAVIGGNVLWPYGVMT